MGSPRGLEPVQIRDPRQANWKPFKTGCVAGFCPNQIENAPKVATVPVFSGVNSQQIHYNWQHFGPLIASIHTQNSTSACPLSPVWTIGGILGSLLVHSVRLVAT